MRRDHVPSAHEVRRMPAGDRGPRLSALAAHYAARLTAAEQAASSTRQRGRMTAYRRALAEIDRLECVFATGTRDFA